MFIILDAPLKRNQSKANQLQSSYDVIKSDMKGVVIADKLFSQHVIAYEQFQELEGLTDQDRNKKIFRILFEGSNKDYDTFLDILREMSYNHLLAKLTAPFMDERKNSFSAGDER